jgi:Domain of unknown function (DUF4815)
MAINFNVNPYHDDYDENKGFHRILFKPGVAVQARELTQLQTIMQTQVERMGKHFFEEGAMVIPGQIAVDTKVKAIKLTTASVGSTNLSASFDGLNKTVVGSTTGVEALVILGINAEGDDPPTLIVRYTKTGTNYTTKEFAAGENIVVKDTATGFTTNVTQASFDSSIASIQEGVYFAQNTFIKVLSQTIALDKYSKTPSYRVGLTISESIVTEIDDGSLYDNATGTSNEGSPGADRYKIELILTKLAVTDDLDQGFFELVRIENGILLKVTNRTQYNILERNIARRTFEESGNYTVNPFRIQIREERNNNRGEWTKGVAYLRNDIVSVGANTYVALDSGIAGAQQPSHLNGTAVSDGTITWLHTETPSFNRGVSLTGGNANFSVGIEPGKAYINGYEIEKIATQYISVPKARDIRSVTSEQVDVTVGNYALVSNVSLSATSSSFNFGQFPKVNLYSNFESTSSPIGTARIRGIYYHSGNASLSNSVYKLSLFNVDLADNLSFQRDVKLLKSTNFTANIAGYLLNPGINSDYVELDKTVTVSGTTVTGQGTSFLTDFKAGDYIYIGATDQLRKVASITDDYTLTLALTAASATSSKYYRAEMAIREPDFLPAVFTMPYEQTKTVSNPIVYLATPIEAASNGSGGLTITAANVVPAGMTINDLVVFNITKGSTQSPVSMTVNGSGLGFNLHGLTPTNTYSVIAPVKGAVSVKTKTSTIKSQLITNDRVKPTKILLEDFDVYRVDSVKQIGVFANNATGNVDITHWFSFDSGQKPSHYERSTLNRKPGFPEPTGNIRVDYRYFSHSGTASFFAASSYNNINYENIPVVSSGRINLAGVLDFRPSPDTTTFSTAGGTGIESPGKFATSYLPHRNYIMTLDYDHYLPRIDKISMDLRGNIFRTAGSSSIVLSEPDDPSSGMTLYKLTLSPYTYHQFDPEVQIGFIDNKRYTMRDIGQLEKRLETIEYYTALSLLEQETSSLSIRDAMGLERFKNGFIVDNFSGHGVGDVTSSDYICSIDMQNRELRPTHTTTNINLIEKTPLDRSTNGYQVTGDIVTLKYTHTVLAQQPFASNVELINPFAIASFNGSVQLNPPGDEWFETETRPDVIINKEGNFDSTVRALSASGGLGTVWNSWQTQWTGQTVGAGGVTVQHSGGQRWTAEEWASITPAGTFANEAFNSLDAAAQARVTRAREAIVYPEPYNGGW